MTDSVFEVQGVVHRSKLMEALDTHSSIDSVFDACVSFRVNKKAVMRPLLLGLLESVKPSHRYLALNFLLSADYNYKADFNLLSTLQNAASKEENQTVCSLYRAYGLIK